MKAIVIYEPGGPEKLIYTDVATPEKFFSLKEVPDAHRYLDSQDSFGKVIVLL